MSRKEEINFSKESYIRRRVPIDVYFGKHNSQNVVIITTKMKTIIYSFVCRFHKDVETVVIRKTQSSKVASSGEITLIWQKIHYKQKISKYASPSSVFLTPSLLLFFPLTNIFFQSVTPFLLLPSMSTR